MKPGILGTAGIRDGLWPSLWCMAKLLGVFFGWACRSGATTVIEKELEEVIHSEMETAKILLEEPDPDRPEEPYMNVSPLDDALHVSNELSNFLRLLLVTIPNDRPEAAEALSSPRFKALVKNAAYPGV